jgi:hypothetical protein
MKNKLTQRALFQALEDAIASIPDERKSHNTKHSLRSAIFIAFSVFFLHSWSLRSHLELLRSRKGKTNKRLFGIDTIPTDNQIRNLLDPLDPNVLCTSQDKIIFQMQRSGVLKDFSVDDDLGCLLAWDGTQYFTSEKICCSSCCQKHHKNDSIEYHHRVLLSGLSHPSKNIFLPLTQEFIVRQDGVEKEDCELNAGYRLLKGLRKRHSQMKLTLLADDLFCKQPFLEKVVEARMSFIIACKPGSHKTTYEWVETARNGGELGIIRQKIREGKTWIEETYEFMNEVPIRDGDDAMLVGFVQLTAREKGSEKIIRRQAFVTNVKLTEKNCVRITTFGRRKWRVENEGNNTLKNLGYCLEHSFGHGKKNLSAIFVMLMLLALMMHAVLALVNQEGFAAMRKAYETLRACMEAIRNVFKLVSCSTWELLYKIGREGLDDS